MNQMANRLQWDMLSQDRFYQNNLSLNSKSTYIKHSSKIYYGLTPQNIKVLAYKLAMANNNVIAVPDTWINHQMATKDWFTLFMKRHERLSIREPEATTLSRATSFNKTNVNLFFDDLKRILEKY